MKQIYRLVHDQARQRAQEAIKTAPEGHIVTISEPTRTLEQNARLWAYLDDVATQVVWHGRKLNSEQWKHIFSAALKRQEVVPNLDGDGFVVLALSTSKMTKREMSDMLELIAAFGSQKGITWRHGEKLPEANISLATRAA